MSNKTQENSELHGNDQIMQYIENKIAQTAVSHPHHVSRNIKLTYPRKPTDIPYDLTMYTHLEATKEHIPNFHTDLEVQPLTKLPLLGKIVRAAQIQLHQIGLFYTNRALAHQLEVNQNLFVYLEKLTVETQKQRRLISQLQAQIYALQEESTK